MVTPERVRGRASTRLLTAAALGLVTAVAALLVAGWTYTFAAGWLAAAAVFLAWNWITIRSMDPRQTAAHATADDPSRGAADAVVLLASLASLVGVAALVVRAHSGTSLDQDVAAVLGVCGVAAAWLVVHTVFTLRYAALYYTGPDGGIDFNQDEPPRYLDFAYLAFTIGMTYQVSDTDLRTSVIRATALRQGLLSYLFGAVVLAATINLVVGLGTSSN